MLSLTRSVTHRIKRFNRNSNSHRHTERSRARTHQTPHWLRKRRRERKIQGHGHYELWFDLPFVPAQLQRLRCWRRWRRSQSQSRNGWCNLRFKLGERVTETIFRWWLRLGIDTCCTINTKKVSKYSQTRTHVHYLICVRAQRMQGKQISLALIHKHTHAQTAHSAGQLINYIAHYIQVNLNVTRKCDNNDNYYCDQLLWSAMLSRC